MAGAQVLIVDAERLVRWLGDGREASGPGDARWWRRVRAGVAAGLAERPGVNLLGHFRYPSGLCEAVTAAARALRAAGVRTSCRDVPASPQHDLPGRSGYLGPELFDHTLLLVAP